MARNRFTNPANGDFYDWQINYSEEEEFGKTRSIEHGANTANTGLVKQQGDDSPLKISVNGVILHKAQLVEMIQWWKLCGTQTIYFKDFTDEEYEVLITSFRPTRHRTIHNPRDFANAPLWYWRYVLEMEVVTIRSGVWAGVVA
jgi:hypothetical protein